MKATDTDLTGWVMYSPHFPATAQRAAVVAVGVRPNRLYELGKEGVASVDDMIGSLRQGSTVVVDGVGRLADSWPRLVKTLQKIGDKGGKVMDARTGTLIDSKPAAMLAEARREYAGEAKFSSGDDPETRGRKGGKASAKKRAIKLGVKHQAMWKDVVKYPTNRHAAHAISADVGRVVSIQTIRRKFKSSGRMSGWKGTAQPELPPIPASIVRASDGKGFVYFIRINGRGPVKIGFAIAVKKRISQLSVGTHKKPVLIASMMGTQKTEKKLHAKYEKLRIKGEWFRYTGDLKVFIESLPDTEA